MSEADSGFKDCVLVFVLTDCVRERPWVVVVVVAVEDCEVERDMLWRREQTWACFSGVESVVAAIASLWSV